MTIIHQSGVSDKAILLEAKNLVKQFRLPGGWLAGRRYVHAVSDVSFQVGKGEVLGLVGESGCGKTTLGRLLLRLLEPTSGQILFEGADLLTLTADQLRQQRQKMQLVFQNPVLSLSPRMKVLDIIAEPVRTHKVLNQGESVEAYVVDLLEQVGLGGQHLNRFPHEMSGGQCQRVAIARALALKPELLVLDEPTSALDVSVQAQILNLLQELQQAQNLTYIFISHDLGVVQHISDRIGVMYLGKIVELGSSESIFNNPLHPYTQALLGAIPLPEVKQDRALFVLQGNVPSPINPPSGCHFHTRCPIATDICRENVPLLRVVGETEQVACHHVLIEEHVG